MSSNRYQELIGFLHYVTLATQPYISFAISKLAQFLVNPAQTHLDAALRVLHYLKGTKKWTLNLVGDVASMAGFMDSDWGGDRDDRKSISTYISHMGNGAISWKTKTRTSVAPQSIEAKFSTTTLALLRSRKTSFSTRAQNTSRFNIILLMSSSKRDSSS